MSKSFPPNLLSQESIKQDYLSNSIKNFEMFNKIYFSVLNFSTKSAKEPIFYDLPHLIAINYPKNHNKHPSEMRN